MRVEIGNSHYKKEAMVYSDYKQKCAGPSLLPYKHPNSSYCSNPCMSGNRLPWIIIIFLIDAGMPPCHYVDAGVYKWLFHLNSPRFLRSLSQQMSWKCWAGFHPLMIILAIFAAKTLRRVETCEKIMKIANQCLFLYQRQNITETYTHIK